MDEERMFQQSPAPRSEWPRQTWEIEDGCVYHEGAPSPRVLMVRGSSIETTKPTWDLKNQPSQSRRAGIKLRGGEGRPASPLTCRFAIVSVAYRRTMLFTTGLGLLML